MNIPVALWASVLLAVTPAALAQTTLVQWNFNAAGLSETAPAPALDAIGGAAAMLVGGATPGMTGAFLSDSGSSDVGTGRAWSIGNFPPQGTGSGDAGAEFHFATSGYEDLTFEFDIRPAITASDTFAILCSTDSGATWVPLAAVPFRLPGNTSATSSVWTTHVGGGGAQPRYALPPGASNAPDVRVRVVAVFDPVLGNAYSPSSMTNGAGAPVQYSPTGLVRLDMVEVKGSPAAPQPPVIVLASSSVTPASACGGLPVHIEVAVAPGTFPTSTSIQMTADVSALGGSSPVAMTPAGVDAQGRWRFTLDTQAAPATPVGARPIPLTAIDDANRPATGTLWFTVASCCPADLDNDGLIANGGARDGGVDINDLLYFLQGFEAGLVAVDLDNDGDASAGQPDGGVDINDLLFFLLRFESGC